MRDDAIRLARIHQAFIPVTGLKCSYAKISSPPSHEHIENFTKDLEVRRDPGNLVSPVNLAQLGSSKEALNPGGWGTAICGLYRYVPL